MSIRIQVIISEQEVIKFRQQAKKNSKSLSSWMRDAAYKALEKEEQKDLTNYNALKLFFQQCTESEQGHEPDWDEQKRLILKGYQQG